MNLELQHYYFIYLQLFIFSIHHLVQKTLVIVKCLSQFPKAKCLVLCDQQAKILKLLIHKDVLQQMLTLIFAFLIWIINQLLPTNQLIDWLLQLLGINLTFHKLQMGPTSQISTGNIKIIQQPLDKQARLMLAKYEAAKRWP